MNSIKPPQVDVLLFAKHCDIHGSGLTLLPVTRDEFTTSDIVDKPMVRCLSDAHEGIGEPIQNITIQLPLRTKWEFPKERFVTYEPSDERWCRPLGIGREITIQETINYPRAYVSSIDDKGNINFVAFAEHDACFSW